MKKKLLLVLLTISIPFALAACSKKEAPPETLPADELVETPAQTQPTQTQEEELTALTDEEIINECLALLGKNDDESANVLGGGTQNYSADGEFLVGRVFNMTLFGAETSMESSYSEAGIVNNITIELKDNDPEYFRVELTELLGEPTERTDTPSESGAVYDKWEKEGKEITLFVTGDMSTLQFTLPDTP